MGYRAELVGGFQDGLIVSVEQPFEWLMFADATASVPERPERPPLPPDTGERLKRGERIFVGEFADADGHEQHPGETEAEPVLVAKVYYRYDGDRNGLRVYRYDPDPPEDAIRGSLEP